MGECGDCKTAGAALHCSGCYEAPTIDGSSQQTVAYCDKECQKAHWADHREECKTLRCRKEFFRAGRLARKIWNTVHGESFENCLVAAEEVDGTLVLQEGDCNALPTLRPNGFYRRFPEEIFRNERDADAALNTLFCCDGQAQMHSLFAWLLRDLSDNIKEATLQVWRPVRNCRYSSADPSDGALYNHQVVLVTLKSGEEYVIDITGAQYGFDDPVIQSRKYLDLCHPHVHRSDPGTLRRGLLCRSFKEELGDRARNHMQRTIATTTELLRRAVETRFFDSVCARYARGRDLLRLPRAAFQAAEDETLAGVAEVVKEATEKLDNILAATVACVRITTQKMLDGADGDEAVDEMMAALLALYHGEWRRDERGVLVSAMLSSS